MKKALFAFVIFAMLHGDTFAATKYWDINGATAGAGGATPSGTWDTGTTANWSTDSAGAIATTTWAASDAAVFSAGGDATGTFTVTPSAAPVAASILIEEGFVIIGGASSVNVGAGTVTLNAGTTLSTSSSARIAMIAGSSYNVTNATLQTTNPGAAGSFVDSDATIAVTGTLTIDYTVANVLNIIQTNSVISGAGANLKKTGVGVIAIVSASTYGGGTEIAGGELRIRTSANRLPVGTAVNMTGGILNLNGLNQQIASLTGTK